MGKKELVKTGGLLMLAAVIILTVLYYAFKVDTETLKIISGFMSVVVISLLGLIKTDKTDKKIDKLADSVGVIKLDNQTMKKGLKDISELFFHKKDITNLSQQIERETSEKFDSIANINVILRDYIVSVNDVITDIISKQYTYDFDLFDPKYFKTKIINRIKHLSNDIAYVGFDKNCFEKVNDKVMTNISTYINELKYIKDLDNGKRRKEFKELTLRLTKQITNHSIYIYENFKKTA